MATKKTIEKEIKSKYPESETITILRSQIKFQAKNPKIHTKTAVQDIVRNFKKVGYLGGIIWNVQTGNLCDGHKRTMALDQINKYDPETKENDYEIKVEKVDFDLKTELEQNVFQTRSRTDLDDELMRQLIPDIDYKSAGLDDNDMSYYGIDLNPEMSDQTVNEIDDFYAPEEKISKPNNTVYHSTEEMEESGEPVKVELTDEEKKQRVKDVKEVTMQKAIEKTQNMDAYFMVSFESYDNKKAFMIRAGLDPNAKMIVGEEFASNVEFL